MIVVIKYHSSSKLHQELVSKSKVQQKVKMAFSKVQLWISFFISAVVLVNGSQFQMYKNLDSEQEHELLDLDADIDPDTGVRRYDNYQLLRAIPSTDEHMEILNFLSKGKK